MTHRMYQNPSQFNGFYPNHNTYPNQMPNHMNGLPKAHTRDMLPLKSKDNADIERELFVGDLSFFCRGHHLEELFSRFGVVLSARIQLSEKKSRHSLMYGFVKMETADQAKMAIAALNGMMFMGRTMRLQQCNVEGKPFPFVPKIGYQIHVSFITRRIADLLINEEYLRSLFACFGEIIDAVICRHYIQENIPKQAGYGFVYYATEDAAKRAIEVMGHYDQDGVVFDSFISHRSSGVDASKSNQPKEFKPPTPRSQFSVAAQLEEDKMNQQHYSNNILGLMPVDSSLDGFYSARLSETSTGNPATDSVTSEASSSNNSIKLGNNSPVGVNETPKVVVMAAPPPSVGKKAQKGVEVDNSEAYARYSNGFGQEGMESFRGHTYSSKRMQGDYPFPNFQSNPYNSHGDYAGSIPQREMYSGHHNPFVSAGNNFGKSPVDLSFQEREGMNEFNNFPRKDRMPATHSVPPNYFNRNQGQEAYPSAYYENHSNYGQFPRGPRSNNNFGAGYDSRSNPATHAANNTFYPPNPPSHHQGQPHFHNPYHQSSSFPDLRSEPYQPSESRWSQQSSAQLQHHQNMQFLHHSRNNDRGASSLLSDVGGGRQLPEMMLFERGDDPKSLLESFDLLKLSPGASSLHDMHAVSALSGSSLSAESAIFSSKNSLFSNELSANSVLDISQSHFESRPRNDLSNFAPF